MLLAHLSAQTNPRLTRNLLNNVSSTLPIRSILPTYSLTDILTLPLQSIALLHPASSHVVRWSASWVVLRFRTTPCSANKPHATVSSDPSLTLRTRSDSLYYNSLYILPSMLCHLTINSNQILLHEPLPSVGCPSAPCGLARYSARVMSHGTHLPSQR